jgi:CheY-like chemotaxis protein
MGKTSEEQERDARRFGTVLVIAADDLRGTLTVELTGAGYRVIALGDSREAAQYLRREAIPPSLIMLDWKVPGLSGLQFVAFHASSPTYCRTPLVVIAEPTCTNVPRLCVSAIVSRPIPTTRVSQIVDQLARRPFA